ncbi:flavodoxin domain-containing protein [Spirillospora sp. NPDC048911]|uniref:flavodoxin domain-containing protein n=1 Tax=Spirillospora sp. NPDC048911 TaxID=3364527 RepID=UPI00371AF3DB
MKILVGYASAHGSTRSIAARIASELVEQGHEAELGSMDQVGTPGSYEAFVLGSAIHNRAWLIEARDFVDAHREVLRHQPVWLFSVGMPAALRGPWRRLALQEEPVVAAPLRDAIGPCEHRLFSGVVRREHFSTFEHLIFKVMGCRYGDYRDWHAVDAWSRDVTRRLASGEGAASRTGGHDAHD